MKQQSSPAVSTSTLLWRISLRLLLIGVLAVFFATLFRPLFNLLAPFLIAYLVTAVLLAPLLRRVGEKLGRRKVISMVMVILLVIVFAGVLFAVGYYLTTQVVGLIEKREELWASVVGAKDSLAAFVAQISGLSMEQVNQSFNQILKNAFDWIQNNLFDIADVQNYLNTLKNAAPAVGNFFLGFLFFVAAVYFTTSEYPHIRRMLGRCVPNFVRPQLRCVKQAAGSATFGYLRAQGILSSLVTLITFIALLIYGQNFALLLALLVGIVDFFPFFGSGMALTPWAIITLLQGDWQRTIFLMILNVSLFLLRKLLEPKIVGDQTGLHPLLTLMSVYVGMKVGGILGMILMPILWMAVVSLYRVGFFDPTLNDIKMLINRIADYARLPKADTDAE